MTEPTHYEVLGVAPDAEAGAIAAAHRRLAQRFHPDVNRDPGSAERMKRINAAYDVLRNPSRRARYDASLSRAASRLAVASAGTAKSDTTARIRVGVWSRTRVAGLAGLATFLAAAAAVVLLALPNDNARTPATPQTVLPVASIPRITSDASGSPTGVPIVATQATATHTPTAPPTATNTPQATPTASPTPGLTPSATPAPPPCQSLPESVQPGLEFDLVTLESEFRRLPVIGDLLTVRGRVRNNCDAPRSVALTLSLHDADDHPVRTSAPPLLLESLAPAEERAFSFRPENAPRTNRAVVTVEPR